MIFHKTYQVLWKPLSLASQYKPCCMRLLLPVLIAGCMQVNEHPPYQPSPTVISIKDLFANFSSDSWEYYLQHLPITEGVILDYQGHPIANQGKQAGILAFDVGKRDLQQCADALMV